MYIYIFIFIIISTDSVFLVHFLQDHPAADFKNSQDSAIVEFTFDAFMAVTQSEKDENHC